MANRHGRSLITRKCKDVDPKVFKAACGRSVDRISLEPNSKKSDGNAERNGFAIFAFLNRLQLSKKSETFRDGSDGYSGHLITYTRARQLGVSRSSTFVGKEHKPRQKMFVLWVHGPSIFGSNLAMDSSSVPSKHVGDPHKSKHRFVVTKISKTLISNVFDC